MANAIPVSAEPSRQVLEDVPARALRFLGDAGTNLIIRQALDSVGYSFEIHTTGWSLLHDVSGYAPGTPFKQVDQEVAAATAELDALDGPLLARIGAALQHNHPDQFAFVMEGLQPAEGAASILNIELLVKRVGQLESGEGRPEALREGDLAAAAKLAARKFGPDERARLGAVVARAKRGIEAPIPEPGLSRFETLRPRLLALYKWYDEWARTARAVIKRRDHLIALGLAKRKQRASPAPV